MADPRFFAVKPCPPQYGSKRAATNASSTQTRNSFFGALGKVGDLQVLNSIGGSKIGTGLRTLASISNSVRTGCGSLPTSIGGAIDSALDTLDTGARWVLEQTGITQDKIDAVSQFNPAIANQAYGQAKSIYERVKQGHFKITDIPGSIQDLQNLERLSRNIFTPQSWYDRNKFTQVCEASPYAVDLINRAPKYKFLFVAQFVFNDGYSSFSDFGNDFAFVIKKSSRPTINFEMEDVNYYNFRTKLITKSMFEEMQMVFHDDGSGYNSATKFVTMYTQASIPVTNKQTWPEMVDAEQQGMSFNQTAIINNTVGAGGYTASRGVLNNDNKTILQEVILYHVFDYGQLVNVYHFFNPRITSLAQDDVDMSVGGEGSEVTITFNYDSVYTELGVPMAAVSNKMADIQGGSASIYKIRNVDSQGAAATPPTAYSPPDPASVPNAGCSPLNTSTDSALPPAISNLTNGIINTGRSAINSLFG